VEPRELQLLHEGREIKSYSTPLPAEMLVSSLYDCPRSEL